MISALSGSDAAIGGLTKALYTTEVNYVNANGGIDGHQLQLIILNNQSDPTVAVAQAKALISDGVVATFYNGSTSEAKDEVVALEQRAHIVGISPEGLEQYSNASAYPYYFSDNSADGQVSQALAAFAQQKGFNDVGVLTDGSPQADDYVTQFKGDATTDSLHIVGSTSYPSTATTMTTELSTLKQDGAKTLALFCYSGCGQVFDSLRQIDWSPNVLVSPNIYYTAFTSVASLGSQTYSACPYSVEPGQQPPAGVVTAIKTLAPAIGGESALDQVLPETADALSVLKYAVEKANSTNGAALAAALQSMNDQTFSDPAVAFTFNGQDHSGYQPNTPNHLMPICGFSSLGSMDMPIRVTD